MRGFRRVQKKRREENQGYNARDCENEVSRHHLLSQIEQRHDQDPTEQKKYWRGKSLEDNQVGATKDRFPQIHSGGVRRAEANDQNLQPNDQHSAPSEEKTRAGGCAAHVAMRET